MSTFIKIAWRNIARSPSRSLITVSAITIGLCSLIFLKGFVNGADQQMAENYTDLLIGHIQIHKTGFQKNMSIEKSMGGLESILDALRKAPEVTAFSERVKDFALISSPEGSAGILLLGVNPVSELKVSTIHRRIRKGEFLKKDDNDKILIGAQLSDNLKAGLGDKIVIMSQAADGSVAAAAYEVAGIIETGAEEIDKGLALITLKAAQDLLVLNGKVSEIVVKLGSLDEVDAATRLLKNKIDQKKFEVLNWKEISPQVYQWLQFDAIFTSIILFVVLLVVATGILNTILMAVLERTREFGIMLALGTKPGQVIFTVAAESFFLGLIGTFIGGLLGTGLVIFFGTNGIDLTVISSALNNLYYDSIIYPRLDLVDIGIYSLIVLTVSIIISIIPALKASRLSPIEAIRHI